MGVNGVPSNKPKPSINDLISQLESPQTPSENKPGMGPSIFGQPNAYDTKHDLKLEFTQSLHKKEKPSLSDEIRLELDNPPKTEQTKEE